MKLLLKASACALALAAFAPATASAQAFLSTFEGAPTPPTNTAPGFIFVTFADGWTAGVGPGNTAGNQIEIQYASPAGSPAPTGGRAFVELDADTGSTNSSMYRVLTTAGTYSLSFLYSPRPNIPATSNGIQVFLNSTLLNPPVTTGAGGATTTWTTINLGNLTVNSGDVLRFSATGTGDTLGGYVDNISFAAVPEPASWAMMIGGFGLIGGAMRRRKTATLATA